MEPENGPSKRRFLVGNHHFSGPMLNFVEVIQLNKAPLETKNTWRLLENPHHSRGIAFLQDGGFFQPVILVFFWGGEFLDPLRIHATIVYLPLPTSVKKTHTKIQITSSSSSSSSSSSFKTCFQLVSFFSQGLKAVLKDSSVVSKFASWENSVEYVFHHRSYRNKYNQ